jgi:phosphate:Na+ symporter
VVSGILTGTIITILLDSSSAVIILTIVLVNAGAITSRQSLGVVMGANIGTTFSSQLIALDVGKYSAIPMVIGLILWLAARGERWKQAGQMLMYFGMLFFGLLTMEESVTPLRDSPDFLTWMKNLETPVTGAGAGALITLIIQSSSATVGMVITLAKQDLITLAAGVAVMLGAELGTCADTLLATIGSSRQALRTGIFHLTFNIVSIVAGLLAFAPFIALVNWMSQGMDIEKQIANAHVTFNVAGVLLFVWFIPLIDRFLNYILPDKPGTVPEMDEALRQEPNA